MIQIQHLTKTFQTAAGTVEALKDISLTIPDGEIYGIIGMSGAGKSTLVRSINMLERPTGGKIFIDGRDIGALSQAELRRERRNITMIFQGFNLLMQRTCQKNVCFPLELAGMKKADAMRRASELLELVGLGDKCKSYPAQLSGGQQQRVGIARAFAANPPIVLMDEPFSALDPMTRAELQNEIHDLQTKAQKTVVFVTHDMDEAIKLADRICIIQDGKVAQCDTPENILKHPANQYVTEFIGANRLWANPEYIRAADIMRRRPFTISKGRTVIQALQIMRHNSVDSLLVLDKGQTLLGVVWLEELIGKREADPIEYYISDDYIAVEGETSLKEIIATIDYDVSGIIPVIQHDRKLLGYLTKSIILATMSKQFVPEHTAGERSGVICPATL